MPDSIPSPILQTRPRPYRRFLTSAFHSRFVHASLAALIIAFDNVVFTSWIAGRGDFWSWFPLGKAFFKIILFYFSTVAVFILRVATLEIGRVTTKSPWSTVRSQAFSLSTLQILFWYIYSAWWFSEICIWFASTQARLGWVLRGDMSTPDRLNERPIYLRTIFIFAAFVQTVRHMYYEQSRLVIPVSPPPSGPTAKDLRTHTLQTPIEAFRNSTISMLLRTFLVSLSTTFCGAICYPLFLRQTFWWIHLQLAKPFFSLPSSNASPAGLRPWYPSIVVQSFFLLMLVFTSWDASSILFSTYIAQEPVKKGQPLSAGSVDPNGTLLNGLRAKKRVAKTFAFWELAVIAQRYPERRKAIFKDIERPDGPRWDKMLDAALEVVDDISTRITASSPHTSLVSSTMVPETAIVELPKIVPTSQSRATGRSIFQTPPKPRTRTEFVENLVQKGLKRAGQSPHPFSPSVEKARPLLKYLKPPGSANTPSANIFELWWTYLEKGPVGWFFKTTPERQINSIVLGNPNGNEAMIVDAAEAVTKMLVASLSEDLYGKAYAGVPGAVKTFTLAITTIEDLLDRYPGHVEAEIKEVLVVLERLKSGLTELLSAFQVYLIDTGLVIGELNAARRAARKRSGSVM